MILKWGSWNDFQDLLSTLQTIAERRSNEERSISVTNVATRWVLQQPGVGAVIVGARLGVSDNAKDNLKAFGWELTDQEMNEIDGFAKGENGERLDKVFGELGDCGREYSATQ